MNYKSLVYLAQKLTEQNSDRENIKEFIVLPAYDASRNQYVREYRKNGRLLELPIPSYPQQEFKVYAVKVISHPHIKETELYLFEEYEEMGMASIGG